VILLFGDVHSFFGLDLDDIRRPSYPNSDSAIISKKFFKPLRAFRQQHHTIDHLPGLAKGAVRLNSALVPNVSDSGPSPQAP
jgi:hypothetical protein